MFALSVRLWCFQSMSTKLVASFGVSEHMYLKYNTSKMQLVQLLAKIRTIKLYHKTITKILFLNCLNSPVSASHSCSLSPSRPCSSFWFPSPPSAWRLMRRLTPSSTRLTCCGTAAPRTWARSMRSKQTLRLPMWKVFASFGSPLSSLCVWPFAQWN